MTYPRSLNAICFGDLKQAALYFDRVLPVAFLRLRGTATDVVVHAPDEIPAQAFSSLVKGTASPDWEVLGYLSRHWQPFIKKVGRRLPHRAMSSEVFPYHEIQKLYLENHSTPELGSIRDEFAEFSRGLGFEYSTVVLPMLEEMDLQFEQAYAVVSMSGVPSVDVSTASWDQIMQLRADEEASRKLRRLRLFVFERYPGKPRAYIEDDLGKRIEDFERTRKALGFDSVVSTLSAVLDARTLQASAAAGLVAALFGGPAAVIGAAAAVELGKISIELANKRQAIRDLEHGHDMAFIATAKRHLV